MVFKDKDHPNKFTDIIYDACRLAKWGRIEDVETFYIKKDRVIFPDNYSGDATFHQTENKDLLYLQVISYLFRKFV